MSKSKKLLTLAIKKNFFEDLEEFFKAKKCFFDLLILKSSSKQDSDILPSRYLAQNFLLAKPFGVTICVCSRRSQRPISRSTLSTKKSKISQSKDFKKRNTDFFNDFIGRRNDIRDFFRIKNSSFSALVCDNLDFKKAIRMEFLDLITLFEVLNNDIDKRESSLDNISEL